MRILSILVRSADRADAMIGYRISGIYGLTTTADREQATVFGSRAAAVRSACSGDHAVPADASMVAIVRAIWGAR